MPVAGQWTVDGSAAGLRRLALQTKATGERGLMTTTRRNIRGAASPATAAVPAYERAVLPKTGGLNEWVASTPVKVSILTGPKTAGVLVRQSKKGRTRPHDLRKMNEEGIVRHPVFADPNKFRKEWTWVEQTGLPTGWWEKSLVPIQAEVTAAMVAVLREAALEAGFR